MYREFIHTNIFDEGCKEVGLTDSELAELQYYLLKTPHAGKIIQGTGGLRKLRWALSNKGKSGGVRVLYIDFTIGEKIYLIDVYTKKERDNISDSEKSLYKQLINQLKK